MFQTGHPYHSKTMGIIIYSEKKNQTFFFGGGEGTNWESVHENFLRIMDIVVLIGI